MSAPDLARSLLGRGYLGVEHDRRRRGQGPTYRTRLLGRPAVVLGTSAGARHFYDRRAVRRAGAVPPPLGWLLFGRGAVHSLDGGAHDARKRLLCDQFTVGGVAVCAAEAGTVLQDLLRRADGRTVDLHDALVVAYGVGALRWVGVSVAPAHEVALARDYARIVDGFGFAGAAYARAWRARLRTDAWARSVVREVRRGTRPATPGTPLHALADSDLDNRTAAVELGNLIRPTVATSWLGCFLVLDTQRHVDHETWSGWAPVKRRSFLHEVRRTTPFVPLLSATATRAAEVDGVAIAEGDRLLLDVHGINRRPSEQDGDAGFRADRYVNADPPPYTFLPQGGEPLEGHRCPGEGMVTALLAATTDVAMSHSLVVLGEWDVDLRRIPTLPDRGPQVQASGA